MARGRHRPVAIDDDASVVWSVRKKSVFIFFRFVNFVQHFVVVVALCGGGLLQCNTDNMPS